MTDRSKQPGSPPPYPEPTIVVGVGRVGLAVLERLGEDWATLQRLRPHQALRNLRLVHVTAPDSDRQPTDLDPCWRAQEAAVRAVVSRMGYGDLANLALDFTLLRALGLVRLVNGMYELARPIDWGAVQATAETGAPGSVLGRPFRARTVEWLSLSADPLVAVERAAEMRRQYGALDRLIGRLLFRVRAGHSPQTVTAAIGRVRALQEGRDPSPWQWVPAVDAWPPDPATGAVNVPVSAPTAAESWGETQLALIGPVARVPHVLQVPDVAVRLATDPTVPYNSMHHALLEADVFDFFARSEGADKNAVHVLPARDAWHGFYDLDSVGWRASGDSEAGDSWGSARARFDARVQLTGSFALQGLVRLWDDLQKQQRRKYDQDGDMHPRGVALRRAVEQCIEILGDAVVRHQLHDAVAEPPHPLPEHGTRPARADLYGPKDLPAAASDRLASLRASETAAPPTADGLDVLRTRLRSLGVTVADDEPDPAWAIFRRVDLTPADVHADLSLEGTPLPGDPAADAEPPGLESLRRTLAGIGRELFDFDYLRSWRRSPMRRSPRLTVYVVGELSEAFVRASAPTLVRMVHSSLARALGPIVAEHRIGLDRALHIVPVLCMPNPADPCGAGALAESRIEEALVLEALHVLRRKLEAAPGSVSCVSQVYLHGRVTDNAVHGLGRCVQNVRDFITLFARNQLTGDGGSRGHGPGLDELFVGRSRADLFATFTCVMAEVPRAQLRWYAGNRLARSVVKALEEGDRSECIALEYGGHRQRLAACLAEHVVEAIQPVRSACARSADLVRQTARAPAAEVDLGTDGHAVATAFAVDQPLQERRAVVDAWRALTADSAEMARAIERLRGDGARICQEDATDTRREHDAWMERAVGAGKPVRAIERAFEEAVQRADAQVLDDDTTCRAQRSSCASTGVPDPRRLEATRADVILAARAKPAWQAMRVVLLLWALMAAVLGAPLSHAAALALELDKRPNGLEWLLGPMAPAVGVLVLWPIAFLLIRRHLRRAAVRLQDAIDRHGEAAAGLFLAPTAATGSAYSFLASRIELLRASTLFAHASMLRTVTVSDRRDLRRIVDSVATLRHRLHAEAERLGVRQVQAATPEVFAAEDTTRVLDGEAGGGRSWLLRGRDLSGLYARWFAGRPREERDKVAQTLRFMRSCDERGANAGFPVHPDWAARIAATVALGRWREQAWLADGDAVVEACSVEFDRHGLRGWPGAEDRVEVELERFVLSHYSNIGFAAQFRGFEGLDEDRLTVEADATLLVDDGLLPADRLNAYRHPGFTLDGASNRPAVTVRALNLDVEAACFLSLARDIQIESLRNLRRFENHFERARPPEDRLFPYSTGGFRPGTLVPVTIASAHPQFVAAARRAFGPPMVADRAAAAEPAETAQRSPTPAAPSATACAGPRDPTGTAANDGAAADNAAAVAAGDDAAPFVADVELYGGERNPEAWIVGAAEGQAQAEADLTADVTLPDPPPRGRRRRSHASSATDGPEGGDS
jgi:hypothetical protein